MASQDLTQANTQNDGALQEDTSDILCVLHPASEAALRIAAYTAITNPDHVLQRHDTGASGGAHYHKQTSQNLDNPSFSFSTSRSQEPNDLALRFSTELRNPAMGFCFGRTAAVCDIDLSAGKSAKRISAQHFRIFVNADGILMLEDMSTNGTIVDTHTIGGKRVPGNCRTRILTGGSIIEILSPVQEEFIKFIVRVPSRDGYHDAYAGKYQEFMARAATEQQRAIKADPAALEKLGRSHLGAVRDKQKYNMVAASAHNHGMMWDGGSRFKCIGVLGKGAFAMVYQVASKTTGEVFAAKEMEKQRFVRNGVLDHRIDNEMKIMQGLKHPHIVQFIEFIPTPSTIVILMENVAGGDMQKYMEACHYLSEDLARVMTPQVLHALDYLHRQNVTHRDIKPDNILIASWTPFHVKLTDFGLSKMVKNNETFLKTFCGTLLYCAPEVFPHYDAYVNNTRPKRPRHGSAQASAQRAYNQQIDIWSFGAVLWFLLCGRPPFAGVVDGTGQGMFNNIMTSTLNVRPLQDHGVSDMAIDLLLRMLNIEPSLRPTENDCMQHPWLRDQPHNLVFPNLPQADENALTAITEEEELDASQLNINDSIVVSRNPLSQDSASQSFENQPQRKRQKGDDILQTTATITPTRSQPAPFLDGALSLDAAMSAPAPERQVMSPPSVDSDTYKFSASHKQDEPEQARRAGPISLPATETTQECYDDHSRLVDTERTEPDPSETEYYREPVYSEAGSLSGAESLVRELRMVSPGTSGAPAAAPEHATPETPRRATAMSSNADAPSFSPEQITPKAPPNRRINLPIRASSFYDPHDISTHNAAYATRVSGIPFTDDRPAVGLTSLPDTALNSLRSFAADARARREKDKLDANADAGTRDSTSSAEHSASTAPSSSSSSPSSPPFARPAPRLGRLVSTPTSFTTITIPLTRRVTSFGRAPGNTHVHPDPADVRVPKCSFEVWFHARELEAMERAGRDWSKQPDLTVLLRAPNRHGVRVNGVWLRDRDERGRRLYGQLHAGDEILVSAGQGGELRFVCEFWHGAAARPRGLGERGFEVMRDENEI